jgi:hypothetical protein
MRTELWQRVRKEEREGESESRVSKAVLAKFGCQTKQKHQGGGKPVHIKMTLFGLYLICYQPHLSIFESF